MIQNKGRRKSFNFYRLVILAMIFTIILIVLYLWAHYNKSTTSTGEESAINDNLLTQEVLYYQPLVEQYAAENQVLSDVNILLAIIRQESNGQVEDVMQSSESAGYPPNYFKRPEASIAQGIYYYATIKQHIIDMFPDQTILTNQQKIQLALQSYNFGKGFIDYVAEQGVFNDTVILNFSHLQDNSCSVEKRQMYGACYGDIYYYQHVERYVDIINNAEDGSWLSH